VKALTIWAPWGSLIMIGAKPVEWRGWSYAERFPRLVDQRIVIHQGARPTGILDMVRGECAQFRALPVLRQPGEPAMSVSPYHEASAPDEHPGRARDRELEALARRPEIINSMALCDEVIEYVKNKIASTEAQVEVARIKVGGAQHMSKETEDWLSRAIFANAKGKQQLARLVGLRRRLDSPRVVEHLFHAVAKVRLPADQYAALMAEAQTLAQNEGAAK
jgi:hypothetical protein